MPSVKKGETRQQFMQRCVPIRHSEHPSEPNKQSVAVCFSMWREHEKKANAELEETPLEEQPTEPKKESEAWQPPTSQKKKSRRTMKSG